MRLANKHEEQSLLKRLPTRRCYYVIAALQIMGTYPWAKRKVDSWTKKLGEYESGPNWKEVFEEHPEFFSVDGEWASLRWRFGYERNYDVVERKELSEQEIKALGIEEKDRISRKPLSSEQVGTLINSAI